ncbi:MAG: AI-2E family transporter [Mogibacterium sp.]|nr:AI-2E family transporter [Mogibacterium sp.]
MGLNKKTMKQIMFLIIFTILLYWGIHNFQVLTKLLSGIVSLISPFLIGICIAFLINLILVPLEKAYRKLEAKRETESTRMQSLRRPICLVLSTLIFLGAICAVFFVLIPQLEKTAQNFAEQFPAYLNEIDTWWQKLSVFLSGHGIVLPAIKIDHDTIMNAVNDFFAKNRSDVVDKTLDITMSVFSVVINVVLAFTFSLYLLAQKEMWKSRSTRLLRAFLPEKKANKTLEVLSISNASFTHFVTGQMMDALVIGFLCFIGMLIFRFPNALPVSVIICFTALIPIFGAWIGAIIGASLILFISPIKALWFIIFLIILQQIEGNLIYPKIVGKSVGLPGLWVLVAVTIGGSAFGILGMLLGVPLCSVLYTLAQNYIVKKENNCDA